MTETLDNIHKILSYAPAFALVLAISYGFSLLARLGWFFDLFRHFLMQYAAGGLILGVALAAGGNWKWALVAFAAGSASFIESRLYLQEPLRFAPPGGKPALTIVQYNQFLHNRKLADVGQWLRRNAATFDIVVIQESTAKTAAMAGTLKDVYSVQLNDSRTDAFGIEILSRHPFLEKEIIPIDGPLMKNTAVRVLIQPPGMKKPTAVYALHTVPPVVPLYKQQRDSELAAVAARVRADTGAHIIFEGDWNITPYSPWFRDLLKDTGLNYQSYGLFLNPTWPSFLPTLLFRIPIDQILFSNGLIQTTKYVGPSNGSDHYAVIAGFAEK